MNRAITLRSMLILSTHILTWHANNLVISDFLPKILYAFLILLVYVSHI
jgi:hypothetical protein